MKAKTEEVFDDYPEFASVLGAIRNLACSATCREGGGKQACLIRDCARDRSHEGCWELLAPRKEFHGETIEKNLETIENLGPDNWSGKRCRHYPWS